MDSMVNTLTDEIETENKWKYFFKNITEESFISSAWAGSTEVEWQILLVFETGSQGAIVIDNIGPCSFDEVFFPYAFDSAKVFGACHAIKFNGKSRYLET